MLHELTERDSHPGGPSIARVVLLYGAILTEMQAEITMRPLRNRPALHKSGAAWTVNPSHTGNYGGQRHVRIGQPYQSRKAHWLKPHNSHSRLNALTCKSPPRNGRPSDPHWSWPTFRDLGHLRRSAPHGDAPVSDDHGESSFWRQRIPPGPIPVWMAI